MFDAICESGKKAFSEMKGHWGIAAVMTLVMLLLLGAVSKLLGMVQEDIELLGTLVVFPLLWGYDIAFLRNHRGEQESVMVSRLFDAFKDFGRIYITMLLVYIYTVLWTFLLVVPGIIKGLSYAMTTYILRDNADLKEDAAIELSMAMMQGHKMELFCMYLVFLLSCIITLGLGLYWFMPWFSQTKAIFYERIKAEYEQNQCV